MTLSRKQFMTVTGWPEARRLDWGRRGVMPFVQSKFGTYDAVNVTLALSADWLTQEVKLPIGRVSTVLREAEPEVRQRAGEFMADAHRVGVLGGELKPWIAGAALVVREVQKSQEGPAGPVHRWIGYCFREDEFGRATPRSQLDQKVFETRSDYLFGMDFNVARGAMLMFVKARRESFELYSAVCRAAGVEPLIDDKGQVLTDG